jgi:hypothetical protein
MRGLWKPRPPGPSAGLLSYPDPKIKIDKAPHVAAGRHSRTGVNDQG